MTPLQILPSRLHEKAEAVVLDVRTEIEHLEKRLSCPHFHVPLDRLDPERFMREHGLTQETPIWILCHAGGRALQAAQKFIAAGFPNAHVIAGGISACEIGGHKLEGTQQGPADKGGRSCCAPLSLERQIRIAAGLLVVIGSLLALVDNALFALLPLFVGGGLVFAGLTNRCGMGLMLAKAPWNKT